MPRPLSDQVVVITGASSGIGRKTAIEFAKRGSSVVLAARNEIALQETSFQVTRHGGIPHVVVTDVSDWEQVQHLARETVDRFGRIDTWVNVASIAEYATIQQTTIDEFQRIMDVNFMGVVHGTKAALPWLREQGHGTIINVGSVLSEVYVPMLGAYTAAKHAVKGFTDTLRLELEHERSGIHVVLVLPSSINTPFFYHARSKIGTLPQPLPPAYKPDIAAKAIVHAAEHPQREIVIGGAVRLFITLEHLSRTLYDAMIYAVGFTAQKSGRPDDGRDNLYEPYGDTGSVEADFDNLTLPSSLYTSLLELHPNVRRVLIFALVGGAIVLLAGPNQPQPRRKYIIRPPERKPDTVFARVFGESIQNLRHTLEERR